MEEAEEGEAGENEAGLTPMEADVGCYDWQADAQGDEDPRSAVDGGSNPGRRHLTEVAGD